jgi:hypothetical protein
MSQDARWLDAADRLTEGDAQAAGTVGSHGQSSIGEGKVRRPRGLDEAEWPGDLCIRHVSECCSYSPESESDGKLSLVHVDRRGRRGDAEGQAGEPVRSSEPERESLRRHYIELPNNVRLKPALRTDRRQRVAVGAHLREVSLLAKLSGAVSHAMHR